MYSSPASPSKVPLATYRVEQAPGERFGLRVQESALARGVFDRLRLRYNKFRQYRRSRSASAASHRM